MLHLVPFAAGIAVGAVALRWLQRRADTAPPAAANPPAAAEAPAAAAPEAAPAPPPRARRAPRKTARKPAP
ncbi:hypothetical protein CKO44_00570 [Rubrivivax gelatinosus]|uniref:hypothetical protein n=1 Tax=Rubrivivax gelatinosus TaxID=28068 RepID=UPI0019075F37|nr:hypothetical protein [Rubrivivax gelatinosus]MBK1611963.1 hypothetical protein [Rubrivivax gelatinosus]